MTVSRWKHHPRHKEWAISLSHHLVRSDSSTSLPEWAPGGAQCPPVTLQTRFLNQDLAPGWHLTFKVSIWEHLLTLFSSPCGYVLLFHPRTLQHCWLGWESSSTVWIWDVSLKRQARVFRNLERCCLLFSKFWWWRNNHVLCQGNWEVKQWVSSKKKKLCLMKLDSEMFLFQLL